MHELVRDVTLCILFAWVLGLLAHFFRQPPIPAYLIVGFFIGPFGIGWVKSQQSIGIVSEIGLIFMPFMIGLEIDLKKIVRAGRKSRSALRNDAGAGSRVRLMLPAQK